jgi:two-component system, sensor histidine kinase and response regulator
MTAPRILVVDDQMINVQLLRRKLERHNLTVIAAYSGQDALDAVNAEKPDLILLDVMMPEMDGIEVCRRLQARDDTRTIPVIFITARNTKEGKIEGLAVGAVDYITKPIDLDETLARVQTQLRFVSINREMVDLQRRLEEARRSATIGAVTQGIAHNLNNLLGVVIGYLDLIKTVAENPDSVRKNTAQVEKAIDRIVNIIKQLNTVVTKTRLPTQRFKLSELIDGAIKRFEVEQSVSEVVFVDNPSGDLKIASHVEIFESSISALLNNAWESYGDHGAAPRTVGLSVTVSEEDAQPMIELHIEDQGRGIPDDIRDHMFEPFISSKHTVGVGMGLTVARNALRQLGGDLVLTDRPGGGTAAVVKHPINPVKGHA